MNVITGGALSSVVLEGIKWLVRTIMKNPTYDFPLSFYAIIIPVLNALAPFALLFLGVPTVDPILSMSVVEVVRYVAVVALGSVVSMLTNTGAIRPLKDYARSL